MTTSLAVGSDVQIELVNGQAPTEIRLLRAGENPSKKGTFLFDKKAAKSVMDAYHQMGRAWVIADYDHGSLQAKPVDPSKSSKSAGRGPLELRGGDLWVTNVKWTPEAKSGIEAGEWPSISPAFEHDEDGRPTWLINFGLTGNPALHAPAELIAANVLRAAMAAVAPDEPDTADQLTEPVQALPETIEANLGAVPTSTAAYASEELNTMKKNRSAAEVAEFFGVSEDEAKAMLSAMKDMYGNSKKEKAMASAVALSVGLGAEAEEQAVIARLSGLTAFERSALQQLGAKEHTEALGLISGLLSNDGKAKLAISELATVKTEMTKGEIETMLSAAKTEKKLTPAEFEDKSETGLRATALAMGDRATSWLKAHLSKRAVHEALSTNFHQPHTTPEHEAGKKPVVDHAGKKYAELSYVERDELSRRDPATFEKLREEHLSSKPGPKTFPMHSPAPGGFFTDLPS